MAQRLGEVGAVARAGVEIARLRDEQEALEEAAAGE